MEMKLIHDIAVAVLIFASGMLVGYMLNIVKNLYLIKRNIFL